ncbi:NAD-dependent epimerase/dehydratase family protein [Pseudokineococcus marinus]|uniref:NAD-dependent epimerase/dehydratase family protein n=1 Tax=Pseudokineococcus marinus TaxID=351215 RepID=A0A849BM55_9ACTN|nr:NAD-dependent epimerase/dehydratase family protein [Pseudokineococcus marinus]NNH21882.1 NAD-dependent epimerase/dehydratase family protein [Pseudokineococcus marinus]
MSTVLVTGASGFLGAAVVAALARHGHSVRALVRDGSRRPGAWGDTDVDIVVGDVRSPEAVDRALAGCDVVVHLAAQVQGSASEQFASTVGGTERLLEGLRRPAGADVRRLVLASSFSVYDWSAARGTLTESSPLEPRPWRRDGYARAKVWQERLLREAAERAPWSLVVLRPGFIWGAERPDVPGVGQRVGGLQLVVRTRLPLTHVENCAEAFAAAVAADVPSGTTANVVDPDVVTSSQYAAASAAATGVHRRVVVPYAAALLLARVARLSGRVIFPRTGGKLPSVLDPVKFQAMFKPLRFPADVARRQLGWTPVLTWEQARASAFAGPEAASEPASAGSAA